MFRALKNTNGLWHTGHKNDTVNVFMAIKFTKQEKMSSCSLFHVGCHAFGIGHSPFRKLPQLDATSVKHSLSGMKKLLLKLNSWFSVLAATCELGKQAVAYGL